MCLLANNLENVRFLNPTAFILGYYITNGGVQINKPLLKRVCRILKRLQDESVTPTDVIRYARFIIGQKVS